MSLARSFIRHSYQIPILGYIFKIIIDNLRLPIFKKVVINRIGQLQSTLNALQQKESNNTHLEPELVQRISQLEKKYSELRANVVLINEGNHPCVVTRDQHNDLLGSLNFLSEKLISQGQLKNLNENSDPNEKIDICFLTSFIPFHIDRQAYALKSWHPYGTVYSLNHKEELKLIKNRKLIENRDDLDFLLFYELEESAYEQVGKHCIYVNSFFDFIERDNNQDRVYIIANSDIIFNFEKIIRQKTLWINSDLSLLLNNGPIFGPRINVLDYELTPELGNSTTLNGMYKYGFDYFILKREHVLPLSRTKFVFGQPWWDYYLPLELMRHWPKTYYLQNEIAFHHNHPIQWDMEAYKSFGRLMLDHYNLNRLNNALPPVSELRGHKVIEEINNSMTLVKID